MRRRPNRRAICIHRSYEVSELASTLGLDKRTVRRWITGGLPAIRDRKPVIVMGEDVLEFLAGRRKQSRRCGPGEFPCFRCQLPRAAAFAEAEIVNANATSLNLRALCIECAATMHRRVSRRNLDRDMPGIAVRALEAEGRLGDSAAACGNVHLRRE